MSEKPRGARPYKSNSGKSFSGKRSGGTDRPFKKREGGSSEGARPSRGRSFGSRSEAPAGDSFRKREDGAARPYRKRDSDSSQKPAYGDRRNRERSTGDSTTRRDSGRPGKFSDRRDKPFHSRDDKRPSTGRFDKPEYPRQERTGRAIINYNTRNAFQDKENKESKGPEDTGTERSERPVSRDRRPAGAGRGYVKREGSSEGGTTRRPREAGDRSHSGDRRSSGPAREGRSSRPYGDKKFGSSGKPAYGERRSFDRDKTSDSGDRRSSGPPREGRSSRPYGDKKFGSSGKPAYGERKSYDRDKTSDSGEGRTERTRPSYDRNASRPYRRDDSDKRRSDSKFTGRSTFSSRKRGPEGRESAPREEKTDWKERKSAPENFFADKLRRNDSPEEAPRKVREKSSDGSKEVRLNKYIAEHGLCSRREADVYIASGVVSVNGVVVTAMGTKVLPGDEIKFNGERLREEKKVYLLLNKPKDYVTTMEDPNAKRTVMELIRGACKERVYPVGRLDRQTTGVLLFTNDGDLTKKLTHPSYNKKKVYHVFLNKVLKSGDMHTLRTGVELEEGIIKADDISYVDEEDKTQVGLEIHTGQNRVVRRMFEALEYNVKKLDRVYFAGLTKKGLQRGEWRILNDKEIRMLKTGSYE